MDKVFDIYKCNDSCRFVLGNDVANPLICIGVDPSTAKDASRRNNGKTPENRQAQSIQRAYYDKS